MTKDIDVIRAFDIKIDEEELLNLKETHNYISDKLILDAINGIKVVATDLNNVSKSRESAFSRMSDGLMGTSTKRQNLINENVIEGINACTSWLNDHDRHISRIDKNICFVVEELDRTQNEILKFYKQHENLKINVEELKESFFSFKESSILRMNNMEKWIKDVDLRDSAYNLLNREFSALKADKYKNLELPIQIYSVLDNIKSGIGGIYYNNEKNISEKNEYKNFIQNELKNYVKDNFDEGHLDNFIDLKSLIKETNRLESLKKDSISFISTQHYNEMVLLNTYPEISDLVSIVSSYSIEEANEVLDNESNISNFISYKDFIEIATKEHLLI